jgi:Ca2+-binding EF-hand superfamily protein
LPFAAPAPSPRGGGGSAASGDTSSSDSDSDSDEAKSDEKEKSDAKRKEAKRERKRKKSKDAKEGKEKFGVRNFERKATFGTKGKEASMGPPRTSRAQSIVGAKGNAAAAATPTTPGHAKRASTSNAPNPAAGKSLISRTNTLRSGGGRDDGGDDGGNFLNQVPIDKLRSMGMAQLNEIWAKYDSDGNGFLDRNELKQLAQDCVDRMITMMEEEIRRANPGISEKNLKKAIEREKMFVLPGKNAAESQREMVKMLVKKLDVNGDGEVTKSELFTQWNGFSKELFQMRSDGALECSIM